MDKVPHVYVVVLADGTVHSVYLDKSMFELQVSQLDKNGVEYRTFELYANSSLKISFTSNVFEQVIEFPPYSETPAQPYVPYGSPTNPTALPSDSSSDDDTPVLGTVEQDVRNSAKRGSTQGSDLLELYKQLDALTGERIEAEMEYEDMLKDYHKELEVYDLKKNSYEDTRERFEEIWNIFQADRKIYQSVVQGAPCPQLFQHKVKVFESFAGDAASADIDEQALFHHYVQNYPENECDGLSDTFKAFFVNSDAYWKDYFSESLDERVRKELRLKYMDAYVSDFDVYKANRMFDDLKCEFFSRVAAEEASLDAESKAEAEIAWLDEYIRTFT